MFPHILRNSGPKAAPTVKNWGSSYFQIQQIRYYTGPTITLTGNHANTYEGQPFSLPIPRTKNGIRIILQAAGGASSNNDADPDSSGNSGATAVFILPKNVGGKIATVLIGAAGGNAALIGYASRNTSSQSISICPNPMGANPVVLGQATMAGMAGYDAALLIDGVIYGYAEGGGATIDFDSANGWPARAWVNTAVATLVTTLNGPMSPGRGSVWDGGPDVMSNYQQFPYLSNAYGAFGFDADPTCGKGGEEASSANAEGANGYPGNICATIL